ncbi:MAG TPA: glutaredoxin family protein [Candidatus Binatia bacterium]|nr:glutaredoxin family protein [Candidatus Binatia bacterium]
MTPAPVILYVVAGCPYCERKRAELAAHGVAVTEIDVGARPEKIPELLKLTRGRRVVPVIVDAGGIAVAPEGGSGF